MEPGADFHASFLLAERRAILHRWVADQMALTPAFSDSVPLVGYCSEFLDRFLADMGEHTTRRSKDWVARMIDDAVMSELTPLSLAAFVTSLKNAINTLWSMEAWSRHADDHAPALYDLVAVVEVTSCLDGILLAGLTALQRKRESDPTGEIDSLELMEQRQREREREIESTPSIEIPDASLELAALASRVSGEGGDPPSRARRDLGSRVHELAAERTRVPPVRPVHPADNGTARLFDPTNEDFLARISHEFRSPLSSILSVCHMCLDGKDTLEKSECSADEAFEIVERSARQLLHLTENLLIIQRRDARSPEPMTFSLHDMAEDLLSMFRPLAQRKGLSLILDVSPRLPDVYADHESLLAVLRNLLANAVNYTSAGQVELWALVDPDDKSGRTVVVGVTDTGAGIADEALEHIFDPFWRGQPSSSENRGSGLGLAIVRQAVDRMRGELAVQSDVGTGSTFLLALPNAFVQSARPRMSA